MNFNPTATPSLPLPIVELVLTYAPRLNHAAESTVSLLGVLPRALISNAFRALVLVSNGGTNHYQPFSGPGTTWAPIQFPQLSLGLLFASLTAEEAPLSQWIDLLDLLMRDGPEKNEMWSQIVVLCLCRGGHLQALQHLCDRFPIVQEWMAECHVEAFESRSLPLIQWMHSNGLFQAQLQSGYPLLALAAETADTHVIDWLAEVMEGAVNTHHVGRAIQVAIQTGREDMAVYLCDPEVLDWRPSDVPPHLNLYENASEYGMVRVLRALKRVGVFIRPSSSSMAMDLASAQGHVQVLDWWLLHSRQHIYSVNAMDSASRNGYLYVLDWWVGSGLEMRFTPAAKQLAYDAGHDDVVKFWVGCRAFQMLSHGPSPDGGPKAIGTKDPATLAAFGRLDWLRVLHGTSLMPANTSSQPPATLIAFFTAAVQFGHVHVLEAYKSDLSSRFPRTHFHALFNTAVTHGQLASLQWLMRPGNLISFSTYCVFSSLQTAIRLGHVRIAQYLLSAPRMQEYLDELDVSEKCALAREAVRNEDYRLLSYLHAVGLVNNEAGPPLLTMAAEGGNLGVFTWWFSEPGLSLPSSTDPVHMAMHMSKLHILEWWVAMAETHDSLTWDPAFVSVLLAERNFETLGWIKRRLLKDEGPQPWWFELC